MVRIDRNPPSPYSIERFYGNIYFEVRNRKKLDSFLKKFNHIMSCLDEDTVLSDYIRTLVEYDLKKYLEKSKEKVVYYAPCKLLQLFECFYGFFTVKGNKVIEFTPVVNVTKDVNLKISLQEIKFVNDHRYMFKPIGIEIFLHNSNESHLLIFDDKPTRETVKEIIVCNAPKIMDVHLDIITKNWTKGLVSNYDYLIYLNRFSSRSFNDISQYPVFPWIISEFSDDEFKMNAKSYYRNLAKPIGALNKNRF